MDKDKNVIYKCENCITGREHFADNQKGHWERHLNTKKHKKMSKLAEESGLICPQCDGKFTKEGLEFHNRNNKKLHELIYRRNNHKSFTVYNQDTWQLGYKEFNGHIGENLPKCGIYKAFRKQFGTFEQMEQHIYKKWDKYKVEIRNIKMGALPDPWEELSRDELASGGIGDGYESDEWNEEMDKHEADAIEKEKLDKQQWNYKNQLIKFNQANFDINKIHPEGGYVLNLNLIKNTLPTETINFFKAIGFYRWDCPRNPIYSTFIELQYDYCNKDIVYSPDDINTCLYNGTFFIDNNGEQEDKVVAISFTKGNETFFKFEDYETSDSESDEEIVESTDSVFVI